MKSEYSTLADHRRIYARVYLTLRLCLAAFTGFTSLPTLAQSVEEKASAAAAEGKETIEDASKTAGRKLDELWRKIDEARLKNRTPDQIVAWLIMGLLVGGILARTTNLQSWRPFVFGLVGAFLGGIAANVTQLDFGLGPVLIRYEDLLFSLIGGVLVLLLVRYMMSRKQKSS